MLTITIKKTMKLGLFNSATAYAHLFRYIRGYTIYKTIMDQG